MSESDPITAIIETAVAEATPAEPEVADTDAGGEDSADAAAEGVEATPEADQGDAAAEGEPEKGKTEPDKGTVEAPKKKRGPMPMDRHEAVLTNTRNKYEAQLAERDKRIVALAKYETPDHQAQLQFLDLLVNDTPRAVEVLRRLDPNKFGKLTWAEQQAAVQEMKADAAAASGAAPSAKPEPDALLPDGTLGYSAEGALKLVEWRLAQERKSFDERFKQLEDGIKPVRHEHEARVAYGQSLEKMSKVLTDARQNWPGFTEHETAIREALEKNPTWDLNAAYRSVVIPSFKADRTKLEAEIERRTIEKINAKGRATTLKPGQVPAAGAPSDGVRDTEDIIRESIRSLKESA